MKRKPRSAKAAVFATVLCSIFSAISALSQTTAIWTGGGDGTNIDSAANWGGISPNPATSDTAEWNGLTTSNLFLINNGIDFTSGPGSSGLNIYLTPNQTNSINIDTTLSISSGFAVWNVTVDANAGALSFGGTNTAHLFYMPERPAGVVHHWINNSTNPITINPRVQFKAGGGATYTMDFSGAGNFIINNYLESDNSGGGITVEVDGPGAMIWTPQGYFGSDLISAVNVTGGTLILKAPHSKMNAGSIANNGSFIFNVPPSQSQTLTGVISGTGNLTVAGGTLTLQGGNSYTGNTILSGGELSAYSAETGTNGPLGIGGTISFTGGTLGYSVSNTFDYSARFDTSAGQVYSIDTAGQNVTFASSLNSSGGSLTKVAAGTLTLAGANSYSGVTTVSAGELQFQGPKTGRGDITIDDGATLGVFATTKSPVTTGTLTVGTSSGATLEFDNVHSTTTPLLAASTLSAAGTITINVNSGTLIPGQRYPLLVWTNGPAQPINLGYLNGASGNLSITGNVLYLNVSPATPTLILAPGGNSLQLSWAGNFKLQVQTNSLMDTWVDYSGGAVSPITVPVDPANRSVFFRLVSTP